jgi:transcriptional regulator with XRE-family HTH domain
MTDPQAAIRAELRRLRRVLGLSQAAAARAIGVHRLVWHRIESGDRQIKFAELVAIAAAFHCRAEDLPGEPLAQSYRAAAAALGQPSARWQPPVY